MSIESGKAVDADNLVIPVISPSSHFTIPSLPFRFLAHIYIYTLPAQTD